MYYSCREDGLHRRGAAIVLDKVTNKSLMEWEALNDLIIRVTLYSKYTKTTTVQCYAPTDDSLERDMDDFYSQLQGVLFSVPKHDILMVMDDLYSKVGYNNNGSERNMESMGWDSEMTTANNF
ncbi:craniofacial development protein 2-like [Elysia marginata]|uniref:Craniofacial development protein 2-like n=1 Tax=Elysia marginata TaxID=1093978 RepID=A0AAV4JEQ7_9GAST|nr:craniofacial development protein 2-like [Elysia marginata]